MNDEDEILFLYIFLNCMVLMLRGNIGYCVVRCIYKKMYVLLCGFYEIYC